MAACAKDATWAATKGPADAGLREAGPGGVADDVRRGPGDVRRRGDRGARGLGEPQVLPDLVLAGGRGEADRPRRGARRGPRRGSRSVPARRHARGRGPSRSSSGGSRLGRNPARAPRPRAVPAPPAPACPFAGVVDEHVVDLVREPVEIGDPRARENGETSLRVGGLQCAQRGERHHDVAHPVRRADERLQAAPRARAGARPRRVRRSFRSCAGGPRPARRPRDARAVRVRGGGRATASSHAPGPRDGTRTPAAPPCDRLARAADVVRGDRAAGRHRLGEDERRALARRGEQENVARREARAGVARHGPRTSSAARPPARAPSLRRRRAPGPLRGRARSRPFRPRRAGRASPRRGPGLSGRRTRPRARDETEAAARPRSRGTRRPADRPERRRPGPRRRRPPSRASATARETAR